MKKILIMMIVFSSLFDLTKALAETRGGCDTLKTYIYNHSSKTLIAYASESGDAQKGQQVIPPGGFVAMGTSTTALPDDNDSLKFDRDANVVSRVTLFSGDTFLAYLAAKKPYTYAPTYRPYIKSSKPELFSFLIKANEIFVLNEFRRGSCAKGINGSWIIWVEDPRPSLEAATAAQFPITYSS